MKCGNSWCSRERIEGRSRCRPCLDSNLRTQRRKRGLPVFTCAVCGGAHRTLDCPERHEVEVDGEYPDERPATRAGCMGMPRPCPFVSCAHHLAHVVVAPGRHGPGQLLREIGREYRTAEALDESLEDAADAAISLRETCALDVADWNGTTLEEIGDLIGLTRERVRQIEDKARERMRRIDDD